MCHVASLPAVHRRRAATPARGHTYLTAHKRVWLQGKAIGAVNRPQDDVEKRIDAMDLPHDEADERSMAEGRPTTRWMSAQSKYRGGPGR